MMKRIEPFQLWMGSRRDITRSSDSIQTLRFNAYLDLSYPELPLQAPRDAIYCRFPLVDGAENSDEVLQLAVETLIRLMRCEIASIVFCGAGLSRTPTIAALALASLTQKTPEECLAPIARLRPIDVNPGFWQFARKAWLSHNQT